MNTHIEKLHIEKAPPPLPGDVERMGAEEKRIAVENEKNGVVLNEKQMADIAVRFGLRVSK